ncbi:unnamed protein product, partial [Linum tenue]
KSKAKSWLITTETTRHKTSSSSNLQKDTQQRITLLTLLGRSAALKQRRKETEASLKDGKSVYSTNILLLPHDPKPCFRYLCGCSLFALCCCWICEECF